MENKQTPQPIPNTPDTCRFCGYGSFSTVLMPEDHPHYAALRCGQCDGFHKWAANPKTKEAQQQLKQQLEELSQSSLLFSWEKQFLSTVINQKKLRLSPKQMEVIKRISTKVGGAK